MNTDNAQWHNEINSLDLYMFQVMYQWFGKTAVSIEKNCHALYQILENG